MALAILQNPHLKRMKKFPHSTIPAKTRKNLKLTEKSLRDIFSQR